MELMSFTDDTAILLFEQTIDTLLYEANAILNTVYDWFRKNKFKLNLFKSNCECFELHVPNDLHSNNLIIHSLECHQT